MTVRKHAWLGAAAVAATLWVSPSAQDLASPGARVLVSDAGPGGIDRGIRDNDPPRDPRQARRGERFVRGSLIARFRDGTQPAARAAMLRRVGASETPRLSYADFDVVAIPFDADPEAAARALDAQPDVEYAQARYRVYPSLVPNDPLYARQWNYPAVGMERAWDINPGATASVTVAVVDSGVAYRDGIMRYQSVGWRVDDDLIGFDPSLEERAGDTFPSLGTLDIPFAAAPDLGGEDRFVAPRDFIWGDLLPVDLDGHGTHVAGTVGQLTNNASGGAGMAFNVRIMPVKVAAGLWDFILGAPRLGTDDTVARGIRYAADNGADVINVSLGRLGDVPALAVESAVAYAVERGAFVVVAAGNSFEDSNPVEQFAAFAPSIDGMVAVGAIGRDRRRAFYSSTGPYVELAAPGGDTTAGGIADGILQQTFDFDFTQTYLAGPARYAPPRFDVFAYEFFQGTSMAAPHVAGLAAMLKQQGISSPAAIEAALKRFATDLGPAGRDDEYGHGMINAAATLRGMGLLR